MPEHVLINGQWRPSDAAGEFQSTNPTTKTPLSAEYPISSWNDCDAALTAASEAAAALAQLPGQRIAEFLERYAERIEDRSADLVDMAHQETALPTSPRLADVELPRTTGQLRQAATAARNESWRRPVIDTANNIRSCLNGCGPVAVFGPNNFPFAFGSVSGGDFAAAIAAGNPVIGKANSSHPGTTKIFAEEAMVAVEESQLPAGTVQLIYRTRHEDGERLVADGRLGATGYTGSRSAGLKLKAAADRVGKPIYLELSSINPVLILPGAIRERGAEIAADFSTSCLMGTGQFCTNPGMVILIESGETNDFIQAVADQFASAAAGTLLSQGVLSSLVESIDQLIVSGAEVLTGHTADGGTGFSYANTLLKVSGATFLENPTALQDEAFGNQSMFVVARDVAEVHQVLAHLEGNLTGCIYSDTAGADDATYDELEPHLRRNVGRLLNDKMPTGVAVSPAMNHGGPYPATGNASFTAVGLPAAIERFGLLHCYDNVRAHRLPTCLRDENPARIWRSVDGKWSPDDAGNA